MRVGLGRNSSIKIGINITVSNSCIMVCELDCNGATKRCMERQPLEADMSLSQIGPPS